MPAAGALRRQSSDELLAVEAIEAKNFFDLMEKTSVTLLLMFWHESQLRCEAQLVYRGMRLQTSAAAEPVAAELKEHGHEYPISASLSWRSALEFATPGMKMSLWEMRALQAGTMSPKKRRTLVDIRRLQEYSGSRFCLQPCRGRSLALRLE